MNSKQMLIPDDMLGRVISAGRVITWGAIPVGGILGGLIATHFGVRAPFIAGTGVLILAAIAAMRVLNTHAIDSAIASISVSAESSLSDHPRQLDAANAPYSTRHESAPTPFQPTRRCASMDRQQATISR
jgi:hypothetical protein